MRRMGVGLCPGCGRSVTTEVVGGYAEQPENRLALIVDGQEVDMVAICRSCARRVGSDLRTAATVLLS